MLDQLTYLAGGLREALKLSRKNSDTHRTVYVTLTDGYIMDFAESIKICERIKSEANGNMPKPIFFMCAFGDGADFSQLEKMILAANGSLTYEFLGKPICDLLHKAEKSADGVQSILTIFKEHVVMAASKKIELLEAQLEKLAQMVKTTEEKKQKAQESESMDHTQIATERKEALEIYFQENVGNKL